MSLFPAYSSDGDDGSKAEERNHSNKWNVELEQATAAAQEAALLASDSSEEDAPQRRSQLPAPVPTPPADDFYLDGKADNTYLDVSTLYYPGRPIYKRAEHHVLGSSESTKVGKGARRRRYFLQADSGAEGGARGAGGAEVAERARALRQLLAGHPRDEELWLRYIEFQEEWADGAAWRAACEEALRAGADGARVRRALHRARAASLPPRDLLAALSADLARLPPAEARPRLRLEGWLRLLWTLGGAGGGEEPQRAALAALQDVRLARAYPLVLYVYGAGLRAAGLWEQLVLLLELVCAVNFPPSPAFPPPAPSADEMRAAERRLQDAEDAVIGSGLPLSTQWVRVERLRAAAHWRAPAAGGADGGADPQRAPAAADVQALLRAVRPSAAALMCVTLLRLAQVPLLPASESARRACAAGPHEEAEGAGAALCALHRARRRLLPPAQASGEGEALRAALAVLLDPPHYFSDDAGYLTWVSALWDACLGWAGSARVRQALACWRLRWLHALARAAPAEEARRLRAQARRVLKLHAPRDPLAFALFARIEADAGEAQSARRVALRALDAAAGGAGGAREPALFAARVVREVVGAREPALAQWALWAAVCGRPLPPAPDLLAPPPPQHLQDAHRECSIRCAELERQFSEAEEEEQEEQEEQEDEEDVVRALTCGAGEWAAARVALLAPRERAAELARLLARRVRAGGAALHYWEAGACALALAAAAEARRAHTARQLAPLFPDNALLALASGSAEWCAPAPAPLTHTAALARVLPALLRAPLHASPQEMGRLARAGARAAARGAGGAPLSALRLEAEARADGRPERAHRVLLAALARHPQHKWVYVRGAAWVPAEAEALCDAALERGLRVHALPHELRPLPAALQRAPPEPTVDSDNITN